MFRRRPVQLKLALPMDDYRVYLAATRILARIMGAQAPDVAALILHELKARRPRVIADEYLYFIGCGEPGRLLPPRAVANARPKKTVCHGRRMRIAAPPADPSRN